MLMFLMLFCVLAVLAAVPHYRAGQRRWRLRQTLRETPAGRTFLF